MSKDKRTALVIRHEGKEREITFEELALSNNLTVEALIRVLIDKGVLNSDELLAELEKVKNERTGQP